MPDTTQLDAALKRLSAALDKCDAAAQRIGRAGLEKNKLVDSLALMQGDRSRLTAELDLARTRAQALEQATDEIALRLGRAGGILRRLLAQAS